jgi:hypothetical protein
MDVDDDMLEHTPKDPDGDGFWAVIIWTIIAVIAVLLLAAYAPLRGV